MAGTPNVSGAPGQFRAASVPDGHHASEVRGVAAAGGSSALLSTPDLRRARGQDSLTQPHLSGGFRGPGCTPYWQPDRARPVRSPSSTGPRTVGGRRSGRLGRGGTARYPQDPRHPRGDPHPREPARLSATWVDRRRCHPDTDPGRRGHAGQTAGPRAGQILSVTSMRSSQVSVRPRIWTSRSSHSGNGCWARYTTRTGADRVHAHVVGPSDPPTGRGPATEVSRARAS